MHARLMWLCSDFRRSALHVPRPIMSQTLEIKRRMVNTSNAEDGLMFRLRGHQVTQSMKEREVTQGKGCDGA
jgi:hypothetical protein